MILVKPNSGKKSGKNPGTMPTIIPINPEKISTAFFVVFEKKKKIIKINKILIKTISILGELS